nr:hypothetical protein BaRGS_029534 [Batillaria attramentaria]
MPVTGCGMACNRNLLECQFDYNVKFKEKINEMGAEEMRFLPAGRDRDGMTYWYLLDKDLNVFVYREEPDDENAESWKLLCSDRFQLAQLVDRLRNNTQRNFLEEDEDTKSSIFTDESKSTSKEGSPDREQKPPDKGSSVKVETDSVKCGIKVKIKTEPGHEECVDTKDGETGKDAVCDKALDQADTMTDSPKGKERTKKKKKRSEASDSPTKTDLLVLQKKKIVGEDSSDFEPEEPVVPAKKGRVGNKSKKAKATPPAKEPETALYNTRRSLRIQTMKKKEPEPEFELSSEGVQSGDTSSEASLQSEDDTEDDFSPQGRNRQRQAALKKKEEEEVPVDDTPCKICDKCTHPDMAKLIEKLAEYLHELETTSRKKDRLVRRKERLAFVGISLDNILKEKKEPPVKKERIQYEDDDDYEEDEEEEERRRQRIRASHKHSHRSGHGHKRDKRGESDGSPLPEEVYAKRSCRQRSSVSYQFKEYDELITAAIEEDVRAPKPPKPPGRSRGKDMSNILGMDSDEEKELRRKEKEEEMAASEATQDGAPPPVVKKKPRRRLTTLDSDENQEDEDDSGDEFQLSESDEDSEASAELSQDEEASEDSGDWRPQRTWFNRAAARRSSRTKGRRGNWSRYDQDFVVDDEYDSDEEASKRRSTRNSSRRKVRYRDWESDSESEALETEESEASFSEVCSDDSEVRRKKRNKNKKPRKKFASDSESDSSGSEYMVRKSRAKKRRVASSESEEEAAPRKTSKSKSASKTKSSKSPQKLKSRAAKEEEDYGSETEVEEDEKPSAKKKKNVLRDSSSEEEEKTHADDNDYGEDEDTEVEDEKEKSVGKEKEASQEKEIVKDDNKAEGKIEPLAENALAEESAPQEKGVGKKAKQSKGKKGKGQIRWDSGLRSHMDRILSLESRCKDHSQRTSTQGMLGIISGRQGWDPSANQDQEVHSQEKASGHRMVKVSTAQGQDHTRERVSIIP